MSHKTPGPFLAARFAGKEAVSKAFGTGIGAHLGWQDIEICRKESGEPYVVLHHKGKTLLDARGGRLVHLSLSHTGKHATAIAILESA
jgi:holo-[acyl-carrier protein] synthase